MTMANAEALLIYWPAAAVMGAFLAVLIAAFWIGKRAVKVKAALEVIGKSRKELDEARVQAKASLGKAKARRVEIQAMHKTAGRLFWQAEKKWIG
jgi:hypothetical protein